jgi:HD-GYP domain-containing protein (c-di-GMP phosphodiesterase class II)
MEVVRKEVELSKFYDTIRPRAYALSTVHTIYRIIGSTLDLEELLPQLARLTLQFFQASRCSIFLTENGSKHFSIRTSVNLNRKRQGMKRNDEPIAMADAKLAAAVMRKGNAVFIPLKIGVPLIMGEETVGAITLARDDGAKPFTAVDQHILVTLGEQAIIAIRHAQLYKEQENLAVGIIKSLAAVLDTKAPRTYTPSAAFIKYVMAVAEELNLSKEEMVSLHCAAVLHDAGAIGIPEKILKKPSRLTPEEFQHVKLHPIKGAEILKPVGVLKPAVPIILHHHERYDGMGYPSGLKGEAIPIGARIMAIVDTFKAMISKRHYQKAKTIDDALKEIKRNSGTQFDPKVVDAFLRAVKKKKIKE